MRGRTYKGRYLYMIRRELKVRLKLVAVMTLYNMIIANSKSIGKGCYGSNGINMASCRCKGRGFKHIQGNTQLRAEYYRFVL